MKTNLSGWQRLWVLISVIYGLLVITIAVAAFHDSKPDLKHFKSLERKFPGEVLDLGTYVVGQPSDSDIKYFREEFAGKPLYVTGPRNSYSDETVVFALDMPNDYKMVMVESDRERVDKVVSSFASEYPIALIRMHIQNLFTVSLFFALPMIGLYAVGFGIGWVAKGFKKQITS